MEPRQARVGMLALTAALLAGCALGGGRKVASPDDGERAPLYWSDLGPDRIDVSSYPPEQRRNYETYAVVCGRCHTLARSVNSPAASRAYWEMYMLGMRMISRTQGSAPITADQRKAILDFLEFDSRKRKIDDAEAFRKQTAELKARFDPLLRERMRKLQESKQPMILSP